MPPCKYFNSKSGCRRGEKCKFSHINIIGRISENQDSEDKDKIASNRENKVGGSTVNRVAQSFKNRNEVLGLTEKEQDYLDDIDDQLNELGSKHVDMQKEITNGTRIIEELSERGEEQFDEQKR